MAKDTFRVVTRGTDGTLHIRDYNKPEALQYAPTISADGLTLYITRFDRAAGFAGPQIYRSTRPTTESPFGSPVHIKGLGNFVEVKNSKIANKSNVSHLSYVGDADIGSGTNLGAGTITANYDHITKKKARTTIGDNVATGSNSVLVAPVKIGDGASVAACTTATKDVPAGALAVGRAPQVNLEGWADKKRQRDQDERPK